MAEPKAQIGFQQVGLGGVLRQYRLLVPLNQREYSWTDQEVTTLLQDFAKAISGEQGEYFLGTICTVPRSLELLEVVDGQQRLATTAILLACIRNYLLNGEALIAESIDNGFLTDIDRGKRERVAKLQLNVDDNEFFRTTITKGAARPEAKRTSHRLIQQAFDICQAQIRNIVAGFDAKDHGDVLNKWIEFIEHGAVVVLLKVPTNANAYKMFETLNDRGLKTSQADLVKNYLFGQAANRLSEAQQKWALMRGTLESLDEEDITVTFLRHALIAIRGYLREPEVYDAVQAQAKGSQTSVAFLNSLETLSTTYAAIFNPEHDKWNHYQDTVRRSIQTLNLLNIKPLRPLMLAIAAKFQPNEAAAAFQMLISLSVRLLIASSTRSGSVETPIAAAANSVFVGEITNAAGLKSKLANVIPGDEQFRQAFETCTASKASLARYYLRSLEMVAKGETVPWFVVNDDRQAINLEHILPEKAEGKWPQFDDEMARVYVKRLGNMALLQAKSNSDLRSSDFEVKKAIYKDAPYELTRQISDADHWTSDRIVERQKGLAALAVRAWPV